LTKDANLQGNLSFKLFNEFHFKVGQLKSRGDFSNVNLGEVSSLTPDYLAG